MCACFFSPPLSGPGEQTKEVNSSTLHMESRAPFPPSSCWHASGFEIQGTLQSPDTRATCLLGHCPGHSPLPLPAEQCRAAQQSRVCQCSLTFRSRPQIINSCSELTGEPLPLRHTSHRLQKQAAEPNHQRSHGQHWERKLLKPGFPASACSQEL